MSHWESVAPGIHRRRYDPLDVSIVSIEGDDGLLIVDTRASPTEGAELLADVVRRFGRAPRWVVNTHAHFDHTFGNQAFTGGSAGVTELYGHTRIAQHFADHEGPRVAAWRADPSREPTRDWHDLRLVAPTHPLDAPLTLELGGRTVDLLPQPPGHTDTDLVVFAPAERVWILGDLVEESGPPMYGSGSHALGWPAVLDALVGRMLPGDVVVPGHGALVDRDYVARQSFELRRIADRFRSAHDRGLSAADALAEHEEWPVPVEWLSGAVERAYRELDEQGPRTANTPSSGPADRT